ncbi:MAG: RecQ family ATP-dependent DNA helicase [Phycisphaerales bacterium]
MRDRALAILRDALGRADAEFRAGQWEAIEGLLNRRRLLVVQRTGWGKSMVYFVAARLLRDRGAGVTLVVSPLLSLMRNQLDAAHRIGIRAATINSTNPDDWDEVIGQLQADAVDVLLVSPERLANDDFRTRVLAPFGGRVGLLVVDEAHCISDWGHDFRPDYRRIAAVLQAMPGNVPVIATTATANDRVVNDVRGQLGANVEVVRGPLIRESVRLQNITIPSPAGRMAWLAQVVPQLRGSGIVYTLTQRDAERVAQWLKLKGIDAEAYHADVDDPENAVALREELERRLLANDLKALVATVALGMGFDKPDLGFVIHFQRPSSVIYYYQQVGRAGRAVDEAFGILLHGEEDDEIAEFFMRSAFPPQRNVTAVLRAIGESIDGLSIPALQEAVNLRKSEVEKAIKYLAVESPSPVVKIGTRWHLTAAAGRYRLDDARIAAITDTRRSEQDEMRRYMEHQGCLMEFLGRALDDPHARPCGKCAGCIGRPLIPLEFDRAVAIEAATFLRRSYLPLSPRKRWPAGNPLPTYGFRGNIGEALVAEEGRALCLWRDAGWGELVVAGKETGRFADELVAACVEMLGQWNPTPAPAWVTCVPSLEHPEIVPDFASRLAAAVRLPFVPCISKERHTAPQKEMQNSVHQVRNLDGAFRVNGVREQPCVLVDDIVNSGWTFTVAAALLRQAGCSAVFPLALALRSPRIE